MKNTADMLESSRNVLFFQWEELLRLQRVVLKSSEHEDIHDLRVASRRFRAALNLLSPLCNDKDVKKLSRQVRTLTRILGTLRNLDEALFFFGSHAQQTDLAGFIAWLSTMRENEQRHIIDELKNFRPGKLDALVRELIAGITVDATIKAGISPLPAYFSSTSINLFETIQSFFPAALCFENNEQRHAMRIAIKKWRYFLEIIFRIVERDNDSGLERLKRYQTLLGSMNDMTVFLEMCSESEASAKDRGIVEQIINAETGRLFNEFIALAENDPLSYSFTL